MNWVDLVIVGAVGLAVLTGFRRGLVAQAFSWGGFVVGITIGALIGPHIVRAVDPQDETLATFVAAAAFLGTAFLVEGLIAVVGIRIAGKIRHATLQRADAIVGSAFAALMSLLAAWFLSVPAKRVPELAPAVRGSVILRVQYALLPSPPDFLAAIGQFLSRTGFPEVFANLNPSLAPGVEPPPAALARDQEVLAAARMTYKIEGAGCGGRVDGSGFPIRSRTVITAAHVVAGTRDTQVIHRNGEAYPARVVFMDTDTDIAVLHVPTLPNRLLGLSEAVARRGTDGAAIGYPGGGRQRISVARVRAKTDAVGYDIYSENRVRREIYVLRARVIKGNSGGPLVDTDGVVRGMIFAASAQTAEESYALTENEIVDALGKAGRRTRQITTGKCAL